MKKGLPSPDCLQEVEALAQLDVLGELVDAVVLGGVSQSAGRAVFARGSVPRYFSTAATTWRAVSSRAGSSSGNRPPKRSSSEARISIRSSESSPISVIGESSVSPSARSRATRRTSSNTISAGAVEVGLERPLAWRRPGRRSWKAQPGAGVGRGAAAAAASRPRHVDRRGLGFAAWPARAALGGRGSFVSGTATGPPRSACRSDSRRGRRAAGSCRWRSWESCRPGPARSRPRASRARPRPPGGWRRTPRPGRPACAARTPAPRPTAPGRPTSTVNAAPQSGTK